MRREMKVIGWLFAVAAVAAAVLHRPVMEILDTATLAMLSGWVASLLKRIEDLEC